MTDRIQALLSEIQTASRIAVRLVGSMNQLSFLDDERTQLAISMCLVRIGEAATTLEQDYPQVVTKSSDIPWKMMRGMRSKIAHDYAEVNLDVIWSTVIEELPKLQMMLERSFDILLARDLEPAATSVTGSLFLPIQPLTKSAFAPFGDVLEPDPSSMRLINSGTTERYHALARAQALGEGASVILNIFRGQARSFPYSVTMMERHPFGSQSFSPLSPDPFLVVVALDAGGKPGVPQVFLATNGQGVNYRANVWHHPLMSLDRISDFLVVDRDGPGHNLEEYFYDTPFLIEEPLR